MLQSVHSGVEGHCATKCTQWGGGALCYKVYTVGWRGTVLQSVHSGVEGHCATKCTQWGGGALCYMRGRAKPYKFLQCLLRQSNRAIDNTRQYIIYVLYIRT